MIYMKKEFIVPSWLVTTSSYKFLIFLHDMFCPQHPDQNALLIQNALITLHVPEKNA